MSRAVVGIIANPAAGKDIRRLVSAASPVSDMAKIGIIRRAAIGAVEGGATRLLVADDRHALARRAVERSGLPVEVLDQPLLSTAADTRRAAAAMAEAGVGAVIVLGGDGTHRDVAKGWRAAPIVTVSTGTNNVFPRAREATIAGHAAGLVAAQRVPFAAVTRRAKVIEAEIERADGSCHADLGLVDVALTSDSFTGSRAVWDVRSLRRLVTAIAEPGSVGLSAIAAALWPTGRHEPGGVDVVFPGGGPGRRLGGASVPTTMVRCAVAPGLYADVEVAEARRFDEGEEVEIEGPGALTFDGERDVVLRDGDRVRLSVRGDGPAVIDVDRAMAASVAAVEREREDRDG